MARTGRPRLNDAGTLEKVAAKLAGGKAGSARSAIMQSMDKPNDANVRRVQRKWREGGEPLLAAAREELCRRRQETDRRAREVAGDGYARGAFVGTTVADLIRDMARGGTLADAVAGMSASAIGHEPLLTAGRFGDGYEGLSTAAAAGRLAEEMVRREREASLSNRITSDDYLGVGALAMAEREMAWGVMGELGRYGGLSAAAAAGGMLVEEMRRKLETAGAIAAIGERTLESYGIGSHVRRSWE